MPLQENFEKFTSAKDKNKNSATPRTSLKSINCSLVKTLKIRKELSLHLHNKKVNQDSPLSKKLLITYLKLKDSFNASLKELSDKSTQLFCKLSKQKRRKEWNKRKAERNMILLDNRKKQTLKLHAQIDLWRETWISKDRDIRKAQAKFKEEKRVLSVARKKQLQLERLKQLYEKLDELRKLRRQRLKKEGHFFPEEDNEFFQSLQDNNATEYELLTENNAAVHLEAANQTKIDDYFNQAGKSLSNLFKLRHQWDYYIATPSSILGSSIPVGPILPCPPSSLHWENYILSDDKDV